MRDLWPETAHSLMPMRILRPRAWFAIRSASWVVASCVAVRVPRIEADARYRAVEKVLSALTLWGTVAEGLRRQRWGKLTRRLLGGASILIRVRCVVVERRACRWQAREAVQKSALSSLRLRTPPKFGSLNCTWPRGLAAGVLAESMVARMGWWNGLRRNYHCEIEADVRFTPTRCVCGD